MDILSAEAMVGWLRPRDALAAVPGHVDENARKSWIILRLQSGVIKAREGNGGLIPTEMWSWREIGSDVWAAGDMRVTDDFGGDSTLAGPEVFSDGTWSSDSPYKHHVRATTTATYFDVRFDPAFFVVPDQDADATPRPTRGPAKWWPAFAEELAVYMHDEGVPPGTGTDGQGDLIKAIQQRVVNRGIAEPSRTAIQPVIQAVLDRLRPASK